MTLRQKTFSGVRWTTFSSLFRGTLQLLQIAILARLLVPEDFGLIALVLALMAFLQIFADAGISNSILHHKDITQNQLSSLYWLNLSASFCLVILLTSLSSTIASWYQQPELEYLFILAALTLFMSALGQQIRVVAQKNLRFPTLGKVESIAAFFGFVTAVSLAWQGAGVYSLAGGSLATAAIGSLLVWLFLADGWRPQLRLRLAEIRKHVKFGAYMIGNNLANTFNSQVDILLGTLLLGAQSIGLYTVPKDLNARILTMINPIIVQVALPVMAKAQDDVLLLRKVYLQTTRMIASVNLPIYVALAFFAPEIVLLVLGDKWQSVIPLMRIFAIWALLRSIINPVGALLIARGRADLSFKWNMILVVIMPPVIWLGSLFGILGMAIAMTGLILAAYIPVWYFLIRPLCGASLRENFDQIAVPLVASFTAGLVGYLGTYFIEHDLARLITGGIIGGLIYLLLSWRFNKVWVDAMKELLTGFRQ